MSEAAGQAAWRHLGWAAGTTLAILLAMGLLLALMPAGVTVNSLQGGEMARSAAELAADTNRYPGWALAFFLGDSLFALSAGWFYLALARVLPRGPLVLLLLAAGLIKVGADLAENALHLAGAAQVLQDEPWEDAPLAALLTLALIKRGGALVASLAAAAAFAGRNGGGLSGGGLSGGLLRLGFLLSAVAAGLGFALQGLEQAFGTLFFLTLALVLWHVRGRLRLPGA